MLQNLWLHVDPTIHLQNYTFAYQKWRYLRCWKSLMVPINLRRYCNLPVGQVTPLPSAQPCLRGSSVSLCADRFASWRGGSMDLTCKTSLCRGLPFVWFFFVCVFEAVTLAAAVEARSLLQSALVSDVLARGRPLCSPWLWVLDPCAHPGCVCWISALTLAVCVGPLCSTRWLWAWLTATPPLVFPAASLWVCAILSSNNL